MVGAAAAAGCVVVGVQLLRQGVWWSVQLLRQGVWWSVQLLRQGVW